MIRSRSSRDCLNKAAFNNVDWKVESALENGGYALGDFFGISGTFHDI